MENQLSTTCVCFENNTDASNKSLSWWNKGIIKYKLEHCLACICLSWDWIPICVECFYLHLMNAISKHPFFFPWLSFYMALVNLRTNCKLTPFHMIVTSSITLLSVCWGFKFPIYIYICNIFDIILTKPCLSLYFFFLYGKYGLKAGRISLSGCGGFCSMETKIWLVGESSLKLTADLYI